MIAQCKNCGGLYATEDGERFAGTPCKCANPKWEDVEYQPKQ